MKKQIFRILTLLLAVAMSISLAGCDDTSPTVPPSVDYGIIYETLSSSSYDSFGYADYGWEIPLTIRFLNEDPNVRINIMESEYYEIIGQSEFYTKDYDFDEENKCLDIDFRIKITKESNGIKAVEFRITCLCGEEDCGRFQYVSDGHYYDDVYNFGFIASEKGIFLANNHKNSELYDQYGLIQNTK